MNGMFGEATDFNQDLSFDVSKVTDVRVYSFVSGQTAELRDLLTSSSTSVPTSYQMAFMFAGATVFKQDLCSFGDDLTMLPVVNFMFSNTMCPVTTSPTDVSGPWCFNCPP